MALLCVLAALIPGPYCFSPPLIILLCLLWIARLPLRETIAGLRRSPVLTGWIVFFALHGLSYFWSENKADSLFDLETKLSFVALPLVVGASAPVSPRWLCRVLNSFAAGVAMVAAGCLLHAWMQYRVEGFSNVFFYHDLVRGLSANAVYTAWYTIAALAVLLFCPLPWLTSNGWGRACHVAVLLLLSFFVFLLSSRTLILFYLLIIVPVAIVQYWRRRGAGRWWVTLTVGAIGLAGITATVLPGPLRHRFEDISTKGISDAFRADYHGYIPHFSNLSLRLFLWRAGVANMKAHNLWLLGAGNGDVHGLQNDRMAALGIEGIDTKPPTSPYYGINLHNMTLQTAVMLGIPAAILFVWLIFSPLFRCRRNPARTFYVVFFCASALFMMQEAALQTQAGIIFYTFFSAIFFASLEPSPGKKMPVNPL